ncbi:MAG: toll/interleukin-1 receptor domain-containing protein [Terriglobales bacterium]
MFLRGAGVPENFILYMHSLTGTAFEYYSCFISYSSKDHEFAERLHNDAQAKGIRCWFAPEDLKIGDKFRQRIDESIRLYDKLLLILSADSIQSTWVENEVEAALEKEKREDKLVLFPVRVDDAVMETENAWAATLRRSRHIGDFRHWRHHNTYQVALNRLLRDLRAEKGNEASVATQ